MVLEHKHDLPAFRAAVREWLRTAVPKDWTQRLASASEHELCEMDRWWMAERHKVGLAIPHWPSQYGGADLQLEHQIVIAEEFALANAPSDSAFVVSLNHVPATLIAWGTQEQKQRYLPTVAAGTVWCQGFSEPNAGSDLASLRTSAVLDGDAYVVNGHKIWSSFSMHADYCILLVRTSTEGKKQDGITFFILDMHAPGVEVRPIRQATGRSEFGEIFLTDVRIPLADRVGAENQGWTVAQSTLAAERGLIAFERAERQRYMLERFLQSSIESGAAWLDEPQLVREFTQLLARLQSLRLLIRQLFAEHGKAGGFSTTPAIVKITGTELRQQFGDFFQRARGLSSQLLDDTPVGAADAPMIQYLNSFGGIIAAGTNEIMRNLIAERGLSMPR